MARAASMALLTVTVAIMSTASSTTVSARKCCPPDHVLTSNLTCSLGSSHYLLYDAETSFNCSGNVTIVQPTQDVLVHCLDIVTEDTGETRLVGVACEDNSTEEFYVPDVHFVRKCCPPNRRYTDFREGCWKSDFPDDDTIVDKLRLMFLNDSDTPVNLQIGVPDCAKGSVLLDTFIHHRLVWRQDSESIILKHQGTSDVLLVPEDFCVDLVTKDNYSLVVRACYDAKVLCDLKKKPCINKCCPNGKSYMGFSCVDAKNSFDVNFFQLHPKKLPIPVYHDSVGIAFGDSSFGCRNGRYNLDPKLNRDDAFYVIDDGRILIPANPMDQIQLSWREFCVELLQDQVVAFVCFPEQHDSQKTPKTLHFQVIAYGLMVSGGFLLITLLVYICLPALHNLHGLTLMCHVAALLLAYAFLVTSQLLPDDIPPPLCTVVSYGILFFFLAAFSWLNVICFDIWWTFGAIRAHVAKSEESRHKFVLYSLYAWFLPLTITSGTFLVDTYSLVPENFLPKMATGFCFFNRDTYGKVLFFYFPVMLQICSNIIFFALTIRNCSKIKSELQQMQNNSNAKLKYHADINKLAMNTKLFTVMGITWACEVVTWHFQHGKTDFWWYILDAANIFQGFFIFLIFVIKKKVARAIKLRIHEIIPSCFKDLIKHRPSSSTIFTTVASSDGRLSSQIKK